MNWFTSFQDFSMVLTIPLMVATVIDLRKNWSAIWDDNLTSKDRQILLRCALFLLMPIAVFLHELGHAWATVSFGGQVAEFHYGIIWGYVVPSGTFTDGQLLFIYLAGNLVELILGLFVLCLVPLSRKPPLTLLMTYFGLWTVAATIVFYPALSLVGMYGDWIAIYRTPLVSVKIVIGAIHLLLIALLAFLVYSHPVRIWFVKKTDPLWADAYSQLIARIKDNDDPEDYLRLAWLFYECGLNSQAQQFVTKFVSRSSHNSESKLLQGLLSLSQGKTEQALATLEEIKADEVLAPAMASRRDAVLELLRTANAKK
jgi:hypothetical protein